MKQLKILSFNANLLPALSFMLVGGQGYDYERLEEFSKSLANYDVVLLQEVFSSPFLLPYFFCKQRLLRSKAENLGFKYIVRGPQPSWWDLIRNGKWTDGGLLILSRYRVLERDAIIFEEGTDVDKGASKGCLYAKIKVGKSSLLVFNCHLQATHTKESSSCSQVRLKQLTHVRRFIQIKSHKNPSSPWMLAGDFNCDAISSSRSDTFGVEAKEYTESDEYKFMINVIDPTSRMTDLLKQKHGFHPSTRPPREVIRGGIRGIFKHKYPQRLDYIFFCDPTEQHPDGVELLAIPELTDVVTFQITNETLPFNYLSDHYAIETSVCYSEELSKSTGTISVITRKESKRKKRKWHALHTVVVLLGLLIYGLVWSTGVKSDISYILTMAVIGLIASYMLKWVRFFPKKRKKKDEHTHEEQESIEHTVAIRRKFKRDYGSSPESESSVHVPMITLNEHYHGIRTLYDNFQHGVKKFSYKYCVGYRKKGNSALHWLTYDDIGRRARNFGSGLVSLGLEPKTKIVIYSENRPEWIIAEQACNAYNFITVPLYDAGATFVEEVLETCEISTIVCSRLKAQSILNLLVKQRSRFKVNTIIQMSRIKYDEYALAQEAKVKLIPFDFVEKDGVIAATPPQPPSSSDAASIVFTYQAQGSIKGVVLTHGNMVNMAKNLLISHIIASREGITENDMHFSFFPLARIFERTVVTLMLYSGACIAFKHPDSRFFEDAAEIKPTILYCIPSDFTKLYGKYKIAISSWGTIRRWIFQAAFGWKKRAIINGKKTPILDYFMFSRYSSHMGGRVRLVMVSSQGHLPHIHKEFLQILFCCKVAECYIRTEIGVVTCTTDSYSGEHAGFPVCEMKLVDVPEFGYSCKKNGGEICVRGNSVTKEYFKNPDLTKKRLAGGWFHTGEIGQWNANGTLTIFGHKEEVLEPKEGNYAFARFLEFVHSRSEFVHQIFIYGKRLHPLIAIIVPDYEAVVKWAKEKHLKLNYEPRFLYANEQIKQAVLADLQSQATQSNLSEFERIRAIHLAYEEIPSLLSLQRSQLFGQFQNVIDKCYQELGSTSPNASPIGRKFRGSHDQEDLPSVLDEVDHVKLEWKLMSFKSAILLTAIWLIYHLCLVVNT